MSDSDGEAGAGDGTIVGVEEEDDYGEGSSSECDRLRDMVVPDDTRRFARHARRLYPRMWPEVRNRPRHTPPSNVERLFGQRPSLHLPNDLTSD